MPRDGSGAHTWPAGSTASSGSTIESAKYNGVLSDCSSEITASLPRSGVAAMTGDLPMGTNKVTGLGAATALTDAIQADQVQDGSVIYAGTVAGTDTYTCTLAPVPASLTAGMSIRGIVTNANTGAATLNPNSLGATSIVKDVSTALAAGDIRAGELCEFVYDGTNFILQDVSVTIPSDASTTEVLTGTDTAKHVTPNALAALWESGSNISSASTISIGEGGFFHVTGTTGITDVDFGTDKTGRRATLVFDGILTITHHATSLILPGGKDITTAAGDIGEFVSEGSDNVRCISFRRAAGIKEYNKGTYTISTVLSQAHGLGVYPDIFNVWLECTTAEKDYSIGDRLLVGTSGDAFNNNNCSVSMDDTTLYLSAGNVTPSFVDRDGTTASAITAANWDVVFAVGMLN